ncbi:MAG TPA: metallophosphoesterase [Xanthobacteraceae bacterium]|nr:metallophosphoesterase [Xanthobacteraceae bacterium]
MLAPPADRPGLRPGISRRRVIRAFGALGVAGFAAAGYGAGIEAESLLVTRYRLTPPRWPAGMRLSISVIADLHAGGPNMLVSHIGRIVATANLLNSDIVLLMGDYFATHRFVTERVPHPVWAAELKRLKARLGVWSIFGNHDWWYDIDGVRAALAGVGIPVLENQAVLIGEAGQRFWLAGLGDQLAHPLGHHRFQGEDDLPHALAQVETDHPVILMVHEPDVFTEVPERVSLTLAGHTHGGQIRLPFVWPRYVPSAYGARFAYGHIVEQGRHMIVSGGLGCSNVPIRLGVPPEIVRIDLG